MKILFITNNMPPHVDGVGDYTMNLAREFARHGHEVTVVCKNIENIRIDYEDIDVRPIVEVWNKKALPPILEVIRTKSIEIVSLQYVPHGFHPQGLPFGLIGIMKRIKKEKIPIFTFFHEVCISLDRLNIKWIVQTIIMRYVTYMVLAYSDYIATSISWYSKRIKNICGCEKVPLIPIPSNIPMKPLNEIERVQLRKSIAPNDEFIIGFFGKRNLDECLKAISKLIKNGRKIKLLSIGKTTLLDQKIEGNTIYKTGILEIGELSQYLHVADCIVLPEPPSGCSFKSGSLMAALRESKVVITSRGFMTDSALLNQFNIIFADSAEDYERELSSIISDRDKLIRIGIQAKLLVKDVDWTGTYQQYLRILQ